MTQVEVVPQTNAVDGILSADIAEILKKARYTKYARFAAYRRLKRRQASGSFVYNLFGVSVVLGSAYLLGFASTVSVELTSFLSFSFIILSLTTLAFQMLEASQQNEKRSLTLYRCAMELSEFSDRLQLVSVDYTVEKALVEYHKILRENEENHDQVDHWYSNHKSYGSGLLERSSFRLQYFFSCYNMLMLYFVSNAGLITLAYAATFG